MVPHKSRKGVIGGRLLGQRRRTHKRQESPTLSLAKSKLIPRQDDLLSAQGAPSTTARMWEQDNLEYGHGVALGVNVDVFVLV